MVAGFARDLSVVFVFGIGSTTDAYLIATVVPTTLAAIAAAGTLNTVVVPLYSRLLVTDPDAADRFAGNAILLVSAGFVGIIGVGIGAANWIVNSQAPGLAPQTTELAVTLMRIAFPMIGTVGLAAFVGGLLNARGEFGIPALGRLLSNVVAFLAVLGLAPTHNMVLITWAIVIASVLQIAVQLPAIRSRLRWHISRPLLSHSVRSAAGFAVPVIAGLLIGEGAQWVVRALASNLGPGSITGLSYALRIFAVPLIVLCGSLAQTLLPRLSRELATSGFATETLTIALRITMLVTLPVSMTMLITSGEISTIVFSFRATSADAIQQIAAPLAALGPSLPAAGVNWMLLSAVYATQQARWALMSWVANALVMIVTAVGLVGPFGLVGLALATLTGGMAQGIVLHIATKHQVPGYSARALATAVLPPLLGSFAMLAVLILAHILLGPVTPPTRTGAAVRLALSTSTGILIYFAICMRLCPAEVRLITHVVGKYSERLGHLFSLRWAR